MNYRKIISLIYVAFILLYAAGIAWGAVVPPDGRGNVNNDQVVNIVDALMIAQYTVGLNPTGFNAQVADADLSGSITIVDALMVAQYTVGLITAFPGSTATPAVTRTPTATRTPTPTPSITSGREFFCEVADSIASEDAPDKAQIKLWCEQYGPRQADGWYEAPFTLSGTAVNGVDYWALPGEVYIEVGTGMGTLPEGSIKNFINIYPIRDNQVEGMETVIITCLGKNMEIQILDSASPVAPEPVYFADPDVERILRDGLDVSPGTFTTNDLLYVTFLHLYSTAIDDLGGVEHLKALTRINLLDTLVTDLGPLAGCTAMTYLKIEDAPCSDLTPVRGLNLETIYIGNTVIADIGALTNMKTLKEAALADNRITDIAPLATLDPAKVTSLILSGNMITDISPLLNLSELTTLYLANNNISTLPGVLNFPALNNLSLASNRITDPAPLCSLQNLSSLDIADNNITNVNALADALSEKLSILDISGNPVTAVTLTAYLTKLRRLNLADTAISDISFLGRTRNLQYLDLSNTQVTDFSPLYQLPQLIEVVMPDGTIREF